jgi:hypothetical protein
MNPLRVRRDKVPWISSTRLEHEHRFADRESLSAHTASAAFLRNRWMNQFPAGVVAHENAHEHASSSWNRSTRAAIQEK